VCPPKAPAHRSAPPPATYSGGRRGRRPFRDAANRCRRARTRHRCRRADAGTDAGVPDAGHRCRRAGRWKRTAGTPVPPGRPSRRTSPEAETHRAGPPLDRSPQAHTSQIHVPMRTGGLISDREGRSLSRVAAPSAAWSDRATEMGVTLRGSTAAPKDRYDLALPAGAGCGIGGGRRHATGSATRQRHRRFWDSSVCTFNRVRHDTVTLPAGVNGVTEAGPSRTAARQRHGAGWAGITPTVRARGGTTSG